MKNPLLFIVFLFISTAGFLQAQDCVITTAELSADSNCLFVTWDPAVDSADRAISILVDGEQYNTVDTVAKLTYSRIAGDETYTCDATGSMGFTGKLSFTYLGGDFTCEYQNGESLPPCPDDVQIYDNNNCLVFHLQQNYNGVPPESVQLNGTDYTNQGYAPNTNDSILIYKDDPGMKCDSLNTSTPLDGTLFIDGQECTYESGVLPITILAFDYTNDENGIALTWEVNAEEPTHKLYLQKSYNGIEWMNVYEQNMDQHPLGQTMEGQYTDLAIEQPRIYYRLLISGFTGEAKYSNVLPVTMKNQVIQNLYYQSNSRSIMIRAGQNFTGEMHLINVHGQNMMTRKVKVLKNSLQEIHLRGNLTPGIYFVKFDNGLVPPTKIFVDQ